MRILSRYVFREIVSSALLGTLLATFVIFLRSVDKYFELLVRSSAGIGTTLWLFALPLPPVLPLSVPFGVLVGILIGLARLATDGEITAMPAEAIALPDAVHSQLQLTLRNASSHEVDKDGVADDSVYPNGQQVLDASQQKQPGIKPFTEMNTGELKRYSRTGANWIEARIELHRRMALPLACMMLALVGIPLGVSSRKGGKSGGYVTGIFLAFF